MRHWYLYCFGFFAVANFLVVVLLETWPGSKAPGPAPLSSRVVKVVDSTGPSRRDHLAGKYDSSSRNSRFRGSDSSGIAFSKRTQPETIPRKIHMTWKTSEVPSWALGNVDTWKQLNPDYEWILHTDSEMDTYIRAQHPELVPVWDKLIAIQKADFYRYIIVLDQGGVYADLDVTCIEPVDKWTAKAREFGTSVGLIVGFEAVVGQRELDLHYFARKFQIAQWVFAGIAGHPVLQNVVDIIVAKLTPMTPEEIASSSVIRTTGPAVWSDAVAQYLQEAYGVVLGERHPTFGSALMREHVQGHHSHIGDVLLLPEVAFGSRDGYHTAGQMVLHNFKGTWKGKKPSPASSVVPTSRKISETGAVIAAKNGGKSTCVDLGSQATLCMLAGSTSPPGEGLEKLVDADLRTKWLHFVDKQPSDHRDEKRLAANNSWLETAPIIQSLQFDFSLAWGGIAAEAIPRLCSYALTSADDFDKRDPWAWRLLGRRLSRAEYSDDTVPDWEVLDARSGESFEHRHQERVFALGCSPDGVSGCDFSDGSAMLYDAFRLEVVRLQNPQKADALQLAELDLLKCVPAVPVDQRATQSNLPRFLAPSRSIVRADNLARPRRLPLFTEKDIESATFAQSIKPRVSTIIHQSWKSRHLPQHFEPFVKSWLVLNPDWEYILWTDADCDSFMAEYFPSYVDMYRNYATGIQRADAFRYFVLYAYGGIYIDLDMEALRPLNAYLSRNFYASANSTDAGVPIGKIDASSTFSGVVLSQEPAVHAKVLYNKDRLACNAAMLSSAGHPFWASAVFPELLERQEIRTVRATGPKMLEAAVQRFERSNARVNSTVVFAAPETFFPKFDDQNEALRKCCDKNFQSECGVGGDKGQVEVSGRAELCDSLKAINFRNPSGQAKYSNSVAKHHWAHTWLGMGFSAGQVDVGAIVGSARPHAPAV